jgi:lysophospholipase L1-like esterase
MVWLGDDFTAGVGAPTPDGSYARLTCAALGYRCYLDAQDGTGFVNWGTGSKTVKRTVHLPGRLWVDQANTDPDVVIVDAGRYDEKESRSATIAQLTLTLAAFTDLLKHPAQQSPRSDGKILVIYPFRLDAPVNTEYHRAMSAQFRAAAAEAHAAYVDPYTAGWFPPGLDYSAIAAPDGIHPNWLGQAYLAEQIVIALGKAGIAGT